MVSFVSSVVKFGKEVRLRADFVLRRVSVVGYEGVALRSPVWSGFFRSNWRVGINSIDTAVDEEHTVHRTSRSQPGPAFELGSPLTGFELQRAGIITQARFGDTVHITNGVEYGPDIEAGNFGHAPEAVLGLTFQATKRELRDILNLAKAGAIGQVFPGAA